MLMQILYKIATNEASAIAFNQIMLLMGINGLPPVLKGQVLQ